MSAIALNTSEAENEIILGKNLSAGRRSLAFLSIVIVYFFYCYNFMVGTFVKPTMIAEAASGGFGLRYSSRKPYLRLCPSEPFPEPLYSAY